MPTGRPRSEVHIPASIFARNRFLRGRNHPKTSENLIFCELRKSISETSSLVTLPSSRQSVSRGISPCGIEKPAVAAGCAGPARRQAGRDAQGSSTSRQLPVVSLSGAIPVPQCGEAVPGPWSRCCATRGRLSDVTSSELNSASGKAKYGALLVPGQRQT